MWDAAKQQQLDELRARAEHSALPPDEQCTLDRVLAELEQQGCYPYLSWIIPTRLDEDMLIGLKRT
jgi:hypothetical protein